MMKIVTTLLLMVFALLSFANEHRFTLPTLKADSIPPVNLTRAAKDYTLVFFFAQNCGFCHKFAPIVESLAADYDMTLLTYSFDGGQIGNLPAPKPVDQTIIHDYFNGIPIACPLLALKHNNGEINVLSQGFTSKDTVLEKFKQIAKADQRKSAESALLKKHLSRQIEITETK